jgi:hypothetical protein
MNRVALVGTVHEEQGLANVPELQAVLERIRPEVIFLEIPSAAFEDFANGRRWNLESIAARRYRDIHHVELIPVDLPTPDEEFFTNIRYLQGRIRTTSAEYCQLIYRDSQYVGAYGFVYLNSEDCSRLWSKIYEAIRATIERLDDHKLREIYECWRTTNELRERAMVRSIEDYCRRNMFDIGVLLIGAAHREAIMNKSRAGCGAPTLQWDFAGCHYGSH